MNTQFGLFSIERIWQYAPFALRLSSLSKNTVFSTWVKLPLPQCIRLPIYHHLRVCELAGIPRRSVDLAMGKKAGDDGRMHAPIVQIRIEVAADPAADHLSKSAKSYAL